MWKLYIDNKLKRSRKAKFNIQYKPILNNNKNFDQE